MSLTFAVTRITLCVITTEASKRLREPQHNWDIATLGQLLLPTCRFGHLPIMKLLIDRGADVEAPISDGRAPLHLAAVNGHETVA